MRVLLFDPFHGAAGDMIVGALLDLGADRECVSAAMASVVREPRISRVRRRNIEGVLVESCAGVQTRSYAEVLQRLHSAQASESAKRMAERIFERMRRAEERIHGTESHFHEIGADDAIAEVLGACVALESLRVDRCVSLPLAVGSGYVESGHGRLPVPAPATLEILKDSALRIRDWGGEGELCTPTGAAILAELCADEEPPTHARVAATGYGAGSRETADAPNVLRAMILESGEAPARDMVDILETNLDDATPEVIGHVMERAMKEGALDASVIPVLMKKGRPGHLIRIISPAMMTDRLASLLAMELGTLGIRVFPGVHRQIAERRSMRIRVKIGGVAEEIDVKVGCWGSTVYALKPEFEQVRALAARLGLPAKQVLGFVEDEARRQIGRRELKG